VGLNSLIRTVPLLTERAVSIDRARWAEAVARGGARNSSEPRARRELQRERERTTADRPCPRLPGRQKAEPPLNRIIGLHKGWYSPPAGRVRPAASPGSPCRRAHRRLTEIRPGRLFVWVDPYRRRTRCAPNALQRHRTRPPVNDEMEIPLATTESRGSHALRGCLSLPRGVVPSGNPAQFVATYVPRDAPGCDVLDQGVLVATRG